MDPNKRKMSRVKVYNKRRREVLINEFPRIWPKPVPMEWMACRIDEEQEGIERLHLINGDFYELEDEIGQIEIWQYHNYVIQDPDFADWREYNWKRPIQTYEFEII